MARADLVQAAASRGLTDLSVRCQRGTRSGGVIITARALRDRGCKTSALNLPFQFVQHRHSGKENSTLRTIFFDSGS